MCREIAVFINFPPVYTKVEVAQYQKARLYFDQKLIRILDAGTYYFWKNNIRVDVNLVDTRLTRMEITGQEIMTQDKVGLRINFVCNYRITDYVKILTEIDDCRANARCGAARSSGLCREAKAGRHSGE